MAKLAFRITINHDKYLREFFWRRFFNPYEIMIAEFMLQRTKAEQVEPVYKSFLEQYPDIKKLSKAHINSLKKYTQSLGLHKKASVFKEAARFVVVNFDGKFPITKQELLKIPGVGDYVAGAIQAVCFNNAEYVIDSNIVRFINRYYGMELTGEIRRKKEIIEKAKELFKVKDQRKFLFSLLDFTALICKPITPACLKCPVNSECKFIKNN